jgi:hypothetical protein
MRDGGSSRSSTEIRQLIRDIKKNPDMLHGEETPAFDELVRIGLPCLKYGVLEMLLSEEVDTRYGADCLVWSITSAKYGFVPGRGWKTDDGEKAFREFWASMGAYSYDATIESRKQSYKKWAEWICTK